MNKNTLIISLESENDIELSRALSEPARILYENGTVAFPTETVYGLGANALDDKAVQQIYEAKGRPSDNPLIVHISDLKMLDQLVLEVRPYAKILMETFWPGPITFVFKKRPEISNKVSGGLSTIAIRMPSHKIALKLIELSGKPIAAPSANLSGKPSPTSSRFVVEDLKGRVDCIIEGGDCEVGLESTVLDVTGEVPVILRPGKVTVEQIIELVGSCELDPAIRGSRIDNSGVAKSPGMKYKHYAPDAEVLVFVGSPSDIVRLFFEQTILLIKKEGKRVGIMTFEEDAEVLSRLLATESEVQSEFEILTVGSSKDWQIYGKKLFENLRQFDVLGCDIILVRGVEEIGLGGAIMNRLKKASEGKVTRI